MWSKLSALWALFRQGEQVADPALWKKRQIKATVLAGALLALTNVARAWGHELPIDPAAANDIAVGVIAAVNVVLTVVTTTKIGLPPLDRADPGAPADNVSAGPLADGNP